MTTPLSGLHLAGVHRCRGKCCLAQGDCGSQQVSGCSLVLIGLQLQLLPGQHRLIARSITRRREELKLPMTTPEEETHPAVWRNQGGKNMVQQGNMYLFINSPSPVCKTPNLGSQSANLFDQHYFSDFSFLHNLPDTSGNSAERYESKNTIQ